MDIFLSFYMLIMILYFSLQSRHKHLEHSTAKCGHISKFLYANNDSIFFPAITSHPNISGQQESIPVGCVPPACRPYPVASTLLDIPTPWKGPGTKILTATERTWDQRYPCKLKNICENITFQQIRCRR